LSSLLKALGSITSTANRRKNEKSNNKRGRLKLGKARLEDQEKTQSLPSGLTPAQGERRETSTQEKHFGYSVGGETVKLGAGVLVPKRW
jgi:hypothetical protein